MEWNNNKLSRPINGVVRLNKSKKYGGRKSFKPISKPSQNHAKIFPKSFQNQRKIIPKSTHNSPKCSLAGTGNRPPRAGHLTTRLPALSLSPGANVTCFWRKPMTSTRVSVPNERPQHVFLNPITNSTHVFGANTRPQHMFLEPMNDNTSFWSQ